jgi:hypothetical protein
MPIPHPGPQVRIVETLFAETKLLEHVGFVLPPLYCDVVDRLLKELLPSCIILRKDTSMQCYLCEVPTEMLKVKWHFIFNFCRLLNHVDINNRAICILLDSQDRLLR